MKNKNIVLGVVAVLIVAIIFAIENPFREGAIIEEADVGTNIGEKAPNFELLTPEGEAVRLSDYKGTPLLINFWATWCPFCEDEMPMFQKKLDKNDFVILAVNLQERDDVAKSWIDERGFTFVILMDPKADVKNAYQVRTQPVTYFIDKNGIIQERKFGPLIEEEFNEKLEKMLEV